MRQRFLAIALAAAASTGAIAFADEQSNDKPEAPRAPFAFFQKKPIRTATDSSLRKK